MKIYYRNRTAKLKNSLKGYSCRRCPFFDTPSYCQWSTSTILDCEDKGWWVDGESIDIFKL